MRCPVPTILRAMRVKVKCELKLSDKTVYCHANKTQLSVIPGVIE